jgi:hypothetical protein
MDLNLDIKIKFALTEAIGALLYERIYIPSAALDDATAALRSSLEAISGAFDGDPPSTYDTMELLRFHTSKLSSVAALMTNGSIIARDESSSANYDVCYTALSRAIELLKNEIHRLRLTS